MAADWIHLDGAGSECFTCVRPELPSRNQGNPEVYPLRRYPVFQAEMQNRPPTDGTLTGAGRSRDLRVQDRAPTPFSS